MPGLHRRPRAHVGASPRCHRYLSAAFLAPCILPARAVAEVLPDWATTPEPQGRLLASLSTSTTKWGTTKTTVTAPGTLGLDKTAKLTKSNQPLPTKPWTPSSPAYEPGQCTDRFRPPSLPPSRATDLNGIALPDTCFKNSGPHHVFVIGDWGGIFNGQDKPISPADRRSKHMPSHHRPFVFGADDCAQRNVAKQMKSRGLSSRPDYVLNVGDNFYWGGVLVKCGGPPGTVDDPVGQWTWVYEKMYDGAGLAGKQWLGVLGNHDFGGFLFTHGWDQAIGYTWSDTEMSTGRWVTPALYWKSKVNYPDFSVDYYFVDSNTFDAMHPDSDPGHNLCSRKHNLEVGATCGVIGPVSIDECPVWFRSLWDAQVQWIRNALEASAADWQIIVTHFPPIRGWGDDVWKELGREFGIDMIISGHVHRQEVHYMGAGNHLAPTAYVISGGGGGITSEDKPDADGNDDQYGFMDLTLTAKEIMIEAISHGGQLRSKTCVHQRLRGGARVESIPRPSLCAAAPPAPPPPAAPRPGPPVAPAPARAPAAQVPPRPLAPAPPPAPPQAAPAAPLPAPPAPLPAAQAPGAGGPQAQGERFTFVGFAGPAEARRACGGGKRLAMPKTTGDVQSLLGAMSAAEGEGYMSTTWPENTIWLGGHWSPKTGRWRWDDGSVIERLDWAPNEPSTGAEQKQETWLCMLLTGQLCDSSPEFSFGVFCEPDEDTAKVTSGPTTTVSQVGKTASGSGSAEGIMQDIAAAIEANTWNSVEVHTPLPMVESVPLNELQERSVMQKDASLHATKMARLLQRTRGFKLDTLVALVTASAGVLLALAAMAIVCRLSSRRVAPPSNSRRRNTLGSSSETVRDNVSQPLVPNAQLPPLQDAAGSEASGGHLP